MKLNNRETKEKFNSLMRKYKVPESLRDLVVFTKTYRWKGKEHYLVTVSSVTIWGKIDNIDYAICPSYGLLVSESGLIYDPTSDTQLEVLSGEYPYCNIPKCGTAQIHKLVAMAWLPNSGRDLKLVVNHKNGNTQEYSKSNLEWSTSSENSIHAFETGLRSDVRQLKMMNLETKAVIEGYSTNALAKSACLPIVKLSRYLNSSRDKPLDGVWTIFSDGGWEHTEVTEMPKNTEYKYTLNNGVKEQHLNSLSDVFSALGIPYTPGYDFKYAVGLSKNVGVSLTRERVREHSFKIQAYALASKETTLFPSIERASSATGISTTTIRLCLLKGDSYSTCGYAFRFESSLDWPSDFTISHRTTKEITCTNGDTIIKANSIRSASALTGVNAKRVTLCLKSGEIFNGWRYVFNDVRSAHAVMHV